MSGHQQNKLKIFNDPVYGFINIPFEEVFDFLEHPYFQRLRRIKQLGLTYLVYPGALHTRFQHAMGAMWLMVQAINTLRGKGHFIDDKEALGVTLAILMHDIGHGPFSHALEGTLIRNISHEELSLMFMETFRDKSPEGISAAIDIYCDRHPKRFLHQLVKGQLDMDRLDYLNRDSFFTGVSEGVVSYDRIIKTLNIAGDKLVTDAKGIYSLEKFIIARRLMYWQVYLHKTVISAESLLISILRRAKYIAKSGAELFSTPILKGFLKNEYSKEDFENNNTLLGDFANLDDSDIYASIKAWMAAPDKVLSILCKNLVERRLFAIELQKEEFDPNYIEKVSYYTKKHFSITDQEIEYFNISGITQNRAYDPGVGNIWIMQKNGTINDIAEVSDQLNIRVLSDPVKKYYICYPKEILKYLNK